MTNIQPKRKFVCGVIGKTAAYGLITATYTIVDETIRLITARRAENWIAGEYEKRRKRF